MKRINLTKYGFVKWPEASFSDDGNRFEGWRAGSTARVSKLVSDGQAYLSVRVEGQLPYDVYSKLPHYKRATWDFNGLSVASLTDALLQDFFNSCVEYEKEYRAAEASIKYPTALELQHKCNHIHAKLALEMNELETLMGEHAVEAAAKFATWEWQNLQEYLTHMLQELSKYNPDTLIPSIIGTARSFTFLQSKADVEPTYWYTSIKEMFQKHSII